ncbi:MAG: HNH endonuclease [Candidatus Heimdallarchaeota archaeon]
MRKLPLPTISDIDTYLTCVAGVNKDELKERFKSCCNDIHKKAEEYSEKAKRAELFTIPPLITKDENYIVIGALTKKELMKLYSYYMVQKEPARSLYDKILVSANDKCPFCGGIGLPSTLDHYLPKANYPQLAVLPINLIPCCKDCNTGKSNSLAKNAEAQALHPYFEKNHFFEEKWISGRVIQERPISVEFYADPPVHWDDLQRNRAISHFKDFDLAKRFSVQTADEISILHSQRSNFMKNYSYEQFRDYLFSVAQGVPFINHWKAVMYNTLANDKWYCSDYV